MTIFRNSILLGLLFSLMVMNSCKKDEPGNQLLGAWKSVEVEDDETYERIITFNADYTGTYKETISEPEETPIIYTFPFEYSIEDNRFTLYVDGDNDNVIYRFSVSGNTLKLYFEGDLVQTFTKV